MRPIKKGLSPGTFSQYKDYKPFLVNDLGIYCSYCERKIGTMLAVEHKQPEKKYPHLILNWDNFLLACVNCNSAKIDKDVTLTDYLFPDRDNTFYAFDYNEDGLVNPASHLSSNPGIEKKAQDTIDLVALNKYQNKNWTTDEILQGAIQRFGQRLNCFNDAKLSLILYNSNPIPELAMSISLTAKNSGFFSIWMKVFENYSEVRKEIINAFKGTAQDCFDPVTTQPITPRTGGFI